MDLDSGIIYENIQPENIKPAGPSQNRGEAQNSKRSRWFVVITVCLGIFCVVLLIAVILLYIHFTVERDELQKDITSMTARVKSLSGELEKRASGSCRYFLSNEQKNWTDSRQFCKDRGGDLVIINSEEEQTYVSSVVDEKAWIGLSDVKKKGNMTWVDKTPLNKGFWHKGEPNHLNNVEDCVEIWKLSQDIMNWNDLQCSEMRRWICEI